MKKNISPLSNGKGQAVDWWFMYKLPVKVGPKKDTTGYEFLYCDAKSRGGPKWSDITMDQDQSATALTLNQIFSENPDTGYILWNDDFPPIKGKRKVKTSSRKGHSKGVLAFNKKSDNAFYLLHSTPRFPGVGTLDLPVFEKKIGQTYLCVNLKNYDTANQIAEVLRVQNEAQVYASKLPDVGRDESLAKLANRDNQPIPDQPAILKFKSKGGVPFRLMAKNRLWSEPEKKGDEGKDLWKDLIGPELKCDLNVETWRDGIVFDDVDTGAKNVTQDALYIDLAPIGLEDYKWRFTKDHAKWGISVKKSPGYVIIADINRQESQEHRGGAAWSLKTRLFGRR